MTRRWPAVVLLITAAIVAAVVLVHVEPEIRRLFSDMTALRERILAYGGWGPLGIVALMIVAVVAAPLPSAPIALAAGTLYGHGWGTLYVIIGAEVGALIAFTIARMLGYGVVRKWVGDPERFRLLGSQNALMGIVFVSRLLPFISFDVVSYAAGLTPLKTWRFALATITGIAPASFLLAHFGGEMGAGDEGRFLAAGMALGFLMLGIGVVEWLAERRRKA